MTNSRRTGERAGALLSDVRPDSEPKYCVRSVFRRRSRTKHTPAEGLLHALWEATDREAVNVRMRFHQPTVDYVARRTADPGPNARSR